MRVAAIHLLQRFAHCCASAASFADQYRLGTQRLARYPFMRVEDCLRVREQAARPGAPAHSAAGNTTAFQTAIIRSGIFKALAAEIAPANGGGRRSDHCQR